MRPLFITLLLVLLVSCHHSGTATKPIDKNLQYLYIYDYSSDQDDYNLLDSLMMYSGNFPAEKSLELYRDTDTLNKTVERSIHIGVFKVESQKFAVITDTIATSFYKFENGNYKKTAQGNAFIGFSITPMQYKDFNNDGYTDVLYTVPSGGSYGDDNFLLFFDPETKNLRYNEHLSLVNATFSGATVTSNTKFLETTYTIDGFNLLLSQTLEYLQGNDDNKKVVIKYNREGKQTSIDTLMLDPIDYER